MAPIDILKELRDRVAGMEAAFASQSSRLERVDERQSAIEGGLEAVTQALGSFERTIRSACEDDRSGQALRDEIERGLEPIRAAVAEIRRMAEEERATLDRRDPGPDIAAMREGMEDVRALAEEVRQYRYRAGQRPGTWQGRLGDWWKHSRSGAATWLVGMVLGAIALTFGLVQIGLAVAPESTRRVVAGAVLGGWSGADFYENGWKLIEASDPNWYAAAQFGLGLIADNQAAVQECMNQSAQATRTARTNGAISPPTFMQVPCTLRFMSGYSLATSRTTLAPPPAFRPGTEAEPLPTPRT